MFHSNRKKMDSNKEFDFLGKIYVWSIVFEPLLFFVIFSQALVGITGNVSRILQFIVILLLLYKYLLSYKSRIKIFNPFFKQYRWYFFYLSFALISGIFGVISNAYTPTLSSSFSSTNASSFSSFINSPYARPLFEYFIAFYYFAYFVILPQSLLRNKDAIDYCLKIFIRVFFISFFIGVVDYLSEALFQIALVPRHFWDWQHVGLRFHGLAGEPRDAFVYLFFGFGLLLLNEKWSGNRGSKYFWFLLFFIAAMLTQSASGFIGLIIAVVLIIVFYIPRMSMRLLIPFIVTGIIISAASIYGITNSERIMDYLKLAPNALKAIETGITLPYLLQIQIVNIWPIWIRLLEIMQLNLIPLFIGTGMGSTSIANSVWYSENGVFNPHANIIRVAFEGGIIGTMLYIKAFLQPLRELPIYQKNKNEIIIYMLLILGVNFGHRSSTLFIFLGLTLLVYNALYKDHQKS